MLHVSFTSSIPSGTSVPYLQIPWFTFPANTIPHSCPLLLCLSHCTLTFDHASCLLSHCMPAFCDTPLPPSIYSTPGPNITSSVINQFPCCTAVYLTQTPCDEECGTFEPNSLYLQFYQRICQGSYLYLPSGKMESFLDSNHLIILHHTTMSAAPITNLKIMMFPVLWLKHFWQQSSLKPQQISVKGISTFSPGTLI
jgi:hypothetical protein